MALKTDDVIRGVLDLAKTAQELEEARKEVNELKMYKSQLERDIEILQRSKNDEQDKFNVDKIVNVKELKELENKITEAKSQHEGIINEAKTQINKLESLKDTINSQNSQLEAKEQKFNDNAQNLSKREQIIEDKKEILKQIKELSKKL